MTPPIHYVVGLKQPITNKKIPSLAACDLEDLIDVEDHTFCEVIVEQIFIDNRHVKPYFDYDMKLNTKEEFNEIDFNRLQEVIIDKTYDFYKDNLKKPKEEAIVCATRHGFSNKDKKYKVSVRVWVKDIGVNMRQLEDHAKAIVKQSDNDDPIYSLRNFDTGIYNKNRKMAMVNGIKDIDDRRRLILVTNHRPCDTIIQHLDEKYQICDIFTDQEKKVCQKESLPATPVQDEPRERYVKDSLSCLSESKDLDKIEKLRHILMNVNGNRADSYNDWIKTLYGIVNETNRSKEGLDLFHEFSKRSEKYDPSECDELYRTTPILGEGKKKITCGTFLHWLKEDNKEVYDFVYNTPKKNTKKQKDEKSLYESLRYDEVMADRLLETFEGKLFKTDMGFFIYDEVRGLWTLDDNLHMGIIQRYSTTIFPRDDEKDPTYNMCFISLYNKAYKLAHAKAPYSKSLDLHKNKGYLLFNNGVLNMYTGKMVDKDPSFCFTRIINRDYDDTLDRSDLKQEVMDKLFDNPFTDIEKREYFLEQLARGAALGCADRMFMFLLGGSASGKGKTTQCLETALDEFVAQFNTSVLVGKKNVNMEDDRSWAWILDIYDRRIAIGNEFEMDHTEQKDKYGNVRTKITCLNGAKLKTLSSNGDKVMCRNVYKAKQQVQNYAYPIIFANDAPDVYGEMAIINRAIYLNTDRSSIFDDNLNPDDPEYFKRDPTIDDYVLRTDVGDALVSILCDYYRRSVDNGPKHRPSCVMKEIEERLDTKNTGFDWVKNNYDVYKGDVKSDFVSQVKDDGTFLYDWNKVGDWYVVVDTMYEWYKSEGNIDSKTKFGTMLTKNKVLAGSKKIKGRTKTVRVGIRKPREGYMFRDEDEDEDNEDDSRSERYDSRSERYEVSPISVIVKQTKIEEKKGRPTTTSGLTPFEKAFGHTKKQ